MTQNFAAALISSLAFMGLGLVGMHTKNCEAECMHQVSTPDDCIDQCFRGVIDAQPESLRLYIRLVMGLFAPLCELFVALHAYRFPLKGLRLRRIYNAVAQNRRDDVKLKPDAPSPPHEAPSKIVLRVENTGEPMLWNGTLAHTMNFINDAPGSKSLTVLFDMVASEQVTRRPPARGEVQESSAEDPIQTEVLSREGAASSSDAEVMPSAECTDHSTSTCIPTEEEHHHLSASCAGGLCNAANKQEIAMQLADLPRESTDSQAKLKEAPQASAVLCCGHVPNTEFGSVRMGPDTFKL